MKKSLYGVMFTITNSITTKKVSLFLSLSERLWGTLLRKVHKRQCRCCHQ